MHIARLIPTIFSICIFIATTCNFHFRVLPDSAGGQHLCKHNVDVYIQASIISYPTWKHSKSLLSEMQLLAQ